MGTEHQLPHQKSTTEYVLPTGAEIIQPAKDNDGALLHSHHSTLTSSIHHHLVRCCHCQEQFEQELIWFQNVCFMFGYSQCLGLSRCYDQ